MSSSVFSNFFKKENPIMKTILILFSLLDFLFLKKFEKGDIVRLEARPEEAAEEGEPQVWATGAAAAVREDAVGAGCERRHPQAGCFQAHAVEEGHGERSAVSAGGGVRRAGEGGEEAV
jgi:hypothetical protein